MIRYVSSVSKVPRPGEFSLTGIAPRFASPLSDDGFESAAADKLDEMRQRTSITGLEPRRGLGRARTPTLEQALSQGVTISSPLLGLSGQALEFSLRGSGGQPRAEIDGEACDITRLNRRLEVGLPNGRSLTLEVGEPSCRVLVSSSEPCGWTASLELIPGQTVPHRAGMTVNFQAPEHEEAGLDRLRVESGKAAQLSRSSLFESTPCEEFIVSGERTRGERANLGREIDGHVLTALNDILPY